MILPVIFWYEGVKEDRSKKLSVIRKKASIYILLCDSSRSKEICFETINFSTLFSIHSVQADARSIAIPKWRREISKEI